MAVKYAYLKTLMLESYDNEEDRDFEQHNNNNTNRNGSSNSVQHNKPNPNGNSAADKAKENNNDNKNNNDKKGSQASSAQINAIKKICDSKGIKVDEKFSSEKTCSSKEASDEIKRLSSLK
jgi:hypothetical protein